MTVDGSTRPCPREQPAKFWVGKQVPDPARGAAVPSGHFVQCVELAWPEVDLPARHGEHDEAAAAEICPAAHPLQLPAPRNE
jgi:hypothetical protein